MRSFAHRLNPSTWPFAWHIAGLKKQADYVNQPQFTPLWYEEFGLDDYSFSRILIPIPG